MNIEQGISFDIQKISILPLSSPPMHPNDLEELVSAGIISADTAEQIRRYYQSKKDGSDNRKCIYKWQPFGEVISFAR
jgi:hypothetical protein